MPTVAGAPFEEPHNVSRTETRIDALVGDWWIYVTLTQGCLFRGEPAKVNAVVGRHGNRTTARENAQPRPWKGLRQGKAAMLENRG